MVKEGTNDKETKLNMVKEAITPPIAKNKIITVNKTEKPHESKINIKNTSNKSDKGISLDKSRPTERNETEDTVKQ